MMTDRKHKTIFKKSTAKTTDEIKSAVHSLKLQQSDYQIRSNDNHIWVAFEGEKKQLWSPTLHLWFEKSDSKIIISGQFGESPLLWLIFLGLKISSIGIFIVSGIIAYYKQELGYNFNIQLFVMFAMVSGWFAMYLASENYKKKGAKQRHGFYDFVDRLAA